MRTMIYSFHAFEQPYYNDPARKNDVTFTGRPLSADTANLCAGYDAVALFTSDDASAPVLRLLRENGIRYITLRSAGYDHIDLREAALLGMRVARVPAYSPYSVAEHAVALMLALNRKLMRANERVRERNFLLDGLTGFDMNGKTAGILGTGKIGSAAARILHGFGCRLLAFDLTENDELKEKYGVEYTDLPSLYEASDIITLHLPLTDRTKYIVDRSAIARMKPGVMLINTSRGGLVNTLGVIDGLKSGHIGYFGTDVYEHERGLFFGDHSDDILEDDTIARLMTFPNVLITGHQAFLTDTALSNIAEATFHNLDCFEKGLACANELAPAKEVAALPEDENA